MKVIVTIGDLMQYGILGISIIFAIGCFLYAVIDVYTREWRYKHFKCPKCKHKGHCKRNYQEKCKWFVKKESK